MLFHTSEFSKNLLHFFLICRIEISLILLSLLPSERYFLIHNRVLLILQDPLLLKDIFDQIFIIILIKKPHILPRSLFFHRLHPFLKDIWPQLLDHNLKMNSLLVKLLIDILVLSQLHLPDTFHLIELMEVRLLPGQILVKGQRLARQMLLGKHVVLHSKLHQLQNLMTFLRDAS